MARRKNVKRIDPRYFLNETVNRNDDGSRLEEALPPEPDWRKGFDPKQVAAAKKAAADKEAPETADPFASAPGLANANMYQHDPERDAAERRYNTSQLARARAAAGMEEGSSLEEPGEVLDEEREAPVTHWIAGPGGLVDQHGDVFVKPGTSFAATRKPGQPGMMVIGTGHGTSTERWFGERPVPYADVQKHRSNSNYKPPQPGPEYRPRRGWNEE